MIPLECGEDCGNSNCMNDDVPQKLPRYVFRRANGSFRYKRNVPKHLRVLLGKDTLYRQLGDSYREAMQNLPQVHAQVEAIFAQETELSARQRSLNIIRGALGDEVADMVLAKAVPEYSQIEDALNDLGKSLHAQKFPQEVVEQVYTGQLQDDAMSLDTVLAEYTEFKSDSPKTHKEITQRVSRLRKDMVAVFGKQKLQYVPLKDITRADANALRDHLLARVSPNSTVRMLSVLKAAVNFAITEHSLHMPNVFANLRIKGAGASKDDRLPMSDEQLHKARANFLDDPIAAALFVTLADTGARVSEISGLRVKDCDVEQGCVHIIPTPWRTLKTRSSHRSVPLSPEALRLLSNLAKGQDPEAPLFPRFAKERGGDTCSVMLMKRLRKTVTDKKVTMHSLRHRMKDKLRNTGCPEAISMAILGHSANTVAANYGSGYALEVMREHLEKVWNS